MLYSTQQKLPGTCYVLYYSLLHALLQVPVLILLDLVQDNVLEKFAWNDVKAPQNEEKQLQCSQEMCTAASPQKVEGLICTRDPYYHGAEEGFEIRGVYVNSSIVDEDALVTTISLQG